MSSRRENAPSASEQAVARIEEARNLLVPRLSQDKAAAAAGMSGGRWRDIVHGRKSMGGGVWAPVPPPPDGTLIRMARAVGVEREVRELLGMLDDYREASPTDDMSSLQPEEMGRTKDGRVLVAFTDEDWAEFLARVRRDREQEDEQAREGEEGRTA